MRIEQYCNLVMKLKSGEFEDLSSDSDRDRDRASSAIGVESFSPGVDNALSSSRESQTGMLDRRRSFILNTEAGTSLLANATRKRLESVSVQRNPNVPTSMGTFPLQNQSLSYKLFEVVENNEYDAPCDGSTSLELAEPDTLRQSIAMCQSTSLPHDVAQVRTSMNDVDDEVQDEQIAINIEKAINAMLVPKRKRTSFAHIARGVLATKRFERNRAEEKQHEVQDIEQGPPPATNPMLQGKCSTIAECTNDSSVSSSV